MDKTMQLERREGWSMDAKGYGVAFGVDKGDLMSVMDAQLWEDTKNHWIIHFLWVNYMYVNYIWIELLTNNDNKSKPHKQDP